MELPLLFMNSDIIVDIINPGYNTGVPPKVMGCLAAGGFILFDYKEDFAREMGEVGTEVMYRNVDELNALIDRYLGDDRRRRDLSRYLQYTVATRHTFGHLSRRILVDEPAWRVP
jgi:spore maturation protein CgeB